MSGEDFHSAYLMAYDDDTRRTNSYIMVSVNCNSVDFCNLFGLHLKFPAVSIVVSTQPCFALLAHPAQPVLSLVVFISLVVFMLPYLRRQQDLLSQCSDRVFLTVYGIYPGSIWILGKQGSD